MASSETSIFYTSLTPTLLKGYQIHVTEVEPNTAQLKSQNTLGSENEVVSTDSIIHISSHSTAPIIAWADKNFKTLKVNLLGKKEIATINIAKHGEDSIQSVSIHAPTSGHALPHFLVHYQSRRASWAEVYHIDHQKGAISKAYDLPKLDGRSAFSVSTVDADVFFLRRTDSEFVLVSSASHGVLERWPVGHARSNGSASDYVVDAVSEIVPKGSTYAIRSACTTSSGDLELARNGQHVWTRPESLSGVKHAVWVEFPDQSELKSELEQERHKNVATAYINRVSRHIQDLKHLPVWLQSIPGRLLNNFGLNILTSAQEPSLDSFGFRKMFIVATEKGRVVALDSGSQGSIIWSTQALQLPPGGSWNVTDIQLDSAGILRITDPDLGRRIGVSLNGDEVYLHDDEIQGIAEDEKAIPIPSPSGNPEMVLISQGIPKIKASSALSGANTLITQKPDGSLIGWRFQGPELTQVWAFEASAGDRIASVTARPTHDPVASIGRPLGDRNVLYKFISLNVLLVTTLNSEASKAKVYLLDSISGQVLYSTSHEAVDTTVGIEATFSENWFAYTLHLDPALANEEKAEGTPKSSLLVVSELFESSIPNDRGPLGASSNVSSLVSTSYSPYVVTAAYVLPSSLSHLTTTSTKQGITPRSILAYSSSLAALLAIPVSLLSPRRPVGRDPTPEEREEGLMRYSSFLDFHPQWTLSHQRELLGINGIVTAPSDMESTSLVFAYGDLDVFGTRVSPIGTFDMLSKGFGKIQLILTVLALAIGTGVLAPMVCFLLTRQLR